MRKKRVESREVVARIGIAHDHEFAPRRFDARGQRRSVTPSWDVDDSGAFSVCNPYRVVAGAIVGDQDLTMYVPRAKITPGDPHTTTDGLCLVEARH